jgi:SNF2 family DNA or RNA helicase
VIAPKKVAESTWTREKDKWDHTKMLRVSPVLGSKTKRIRALCTPADIYVINRDNVCWLVDYYRNDWPFDMVIIDESTSFKSHKAKRFKSLASITSKIDRMVLLTGTPSPNGVEDLWSQIYLLDQGGRLGSRYTQFRERYFDPDKRSRNIIYSYKLKDDHSYTSITDKISDICVSLKAEDYLQLPDIVYNTVSVDLDQRARKSYDDMERDLILSLPEDEEEISVASAAALSNKLLQLANGAIYDEDHAVHPIHDCKMESFLELIEGLNGKPVLVFYSFKHDKDRIHEALKKNNLEVRDLVSDQDVEDWNAGKINILLTHPASSAYGLNLQEGGNHVIWFGLTWNLELYQQANKRLHRQGQKEKVFVHRLVCRDTRDEDVLAALEFKGDAQEFVLESLKARIKKVKEKSGV